jgi:hypothetical protein
MADIDATFTKPEINAEPCSFGFVLPSFSFSFNLVLPDFPPPIPLPRFRLALSCDLSKPIDVSAGIEFGGGRVSNAPKSPDDDDSF